MARKDDYHVNGCHTYIAKAIRVFDEKISEDFFF